MAGLLVLFAGLKLREMPVDVLPELNAPTVVIMSEAGGLSADEVETTVTFPIETAVNGLPDTRRVRSASSTSLSIIWVEFDWGTDLYRARQLVSERLSAVREALPPNVHTEISPITSITGEVMLLALSSPDGSVSPLDLRAYAEFNLQNRLLAVSGVAKVVAMGGELPQYQVEVRQDRRARALDRRGRRGRDRRAQHRDGGLPRGCRPSGAPDPADGARAIGRRHRPHGGEGRPRHADHDRRCRRCAARARAEARHGGRPRDSRGRPEHPEVAGHQHA
jgi:hypothetical protein